MIMKEGRTTLTIIPKHPPGIDHRHYLLGRSKITLYSSKYVQTIDNVTKN